MKKHLYPLLFTASLLCVTLLRAGPVYTNQTANDAGTVMAEPELILKPLTVFAYGTWDGATLYVELSPDNGVTWIPTSELTFTENSIKLLEVGGAVKIRGRLTSAGAGTSLSLILL